MDKEIAQLFANNGLSEYIDLFDEHKLDTPEVLGMLTEVDLEKISIDIIGIRKRMMSAFVVYRDLPHAEPTRVIEDSNLQAPGPSFTTTEEDTRGRKTWALIALSISVVFIIVFTLLIFNQPRAPYQTSSPTTESWFLKDNSRDAYFVVTDFVKDMLSFPSGAEFPSFASSSVSVERVSSSSRLYAVSGYVMIPAASGIKNRRPYVATVEQTTETQWTLKNFEWK